MMIIPGEAAAHAAPGQDTVFADEADTGVHMAVADDDCCHVDGICIGKLMPATLEPVAGFGIWTTLSGSPDSQIVRSLAPAADPPPPRA